MERHIRDLQLSTRAALRDVGVSEAEASEVGLDSMVFCPQSFVLPCGATCMMSAAPCTTHNAKNTTTVIKNTKPSGECGHLLKKSELLMVARGNVEAFAAEIAALDGKCDLMDEITMLFPFTSREFTEAVRASTIPHAAAKARVLETIGDFVQTMTCKHLTEAFRETAIRNMDRMCTLILARGGYWTDGGVQRGKMFGFMTATVLAYKQIVDSIRTVQMRNPTLTINFLALGSSPIESLWGWGAGRVGYMPPCSVLVRMLAKGATVHALMDDPAHGVYIHSKARKQFYEMEQSEGLGDASARKVNGRARLSYLRPKQALTVLYVPYPGLDCLIYALSRP